jgi:uncharacterized integral membrane protein
MTKSMSNQIRWLPNPESLPMNAKLKNNRFAGIAIIVLGIIVFSFGISIIFFMQMLLEQPLLAIVLGVIVMGLGLIAIIHGKRMASYREEVTLSNDSVSKVINDQNGRQSWVEPLSSYKGILRKNSFHRNSYPESYYFLVLVHNEDADKNVLLFKDTSWKHLDAAIASFSGLLNVSELKQDS